MSQSTDASLLTLSLAAERAVPIPVKQPLADSIASTRQHRRQFASSPRHSRRLSNELATQRLSPSSIQPSSIGSLGVGSLSLSSSPGAVSTSHGSTTSTSDRKKRGSTPIPIAKPGKKRGHDYKCETCAKIYRHPSCLIKHRWEHTAHWRESSKYVLSKHQQVQLLEAAAILSHLSPSSKTGTSLPEDRSLWPCYLSKGTLPPPEGMELPPYSMDITSTSPEDQVSISAPLTQNNKHRGGRAGRTSSSGPRLHDYSIPISIPENTVVSSDTQSARLIGIPMGSSGTSNGYREHTPAISESWMSASSSTSPRWSSYHHHPYGVSTTGISLPRSSSVRSDSGSDSDSISDEEDGEGVGIQIDDSEIGVVVNGGEEEEGDDANGERYFPNKRPVLREENEWDGMDMEMDMD